MKPEHKHLIIRAEVEQPPVEKDKQRISDWMRKLIKTIDMKLLAGPYCRYVPLKGNKGITIVAIIETSHIALHVWEEHDPPLIQLDVYTCGPFTPIKVFNAMKEFDPVKIGWKYLDRERDLNTLDIGTWQEGSPWPSKASLTTPAVG